MIMTVMYTRLYGSGVAAFVLTRLSVIHPGLPEGFRPGENCLKVPPALMATFSSEAVTGTTMKLLLIQGANMEYLGRRQPELYGATTAKGLDAILRKQARRLGVTVDILYTNTEGEAVSALYEADRARIDGILFNPAGFLQAGQALRDCLKSIRAPAIEIHMTNIEKRGRSSVTSEAALGMIAGFGVDSYVLALDAMVSRLRKPAGF
jgi:3-dehydroquinate dehydratase-2